MMIIPMYFLDMLEYCLVLSMLYTKLYRLICPHQLQNYRIMCILQTYRQVRYQQTVPTSMDG